MAVWLVAFDEPHEIQRIKVHSGVGYPDHHLTAFRILYCNEKGAAYFSGYDRKSCWRAMENLTGVTVALDGEKLVMFRIWGFSLVTVALDGEKLEMFRIWGFSLVTVALEAVDASHTRFLCILNTPPKRIGGREVFFWGGGALPSMAWT